MVKEEKTLMKNKRGIYFIIGILLILVLLVVYIVLKKQNDTNSEDNTEEGTSTSEKLLNFTSEEVTAMSFLDGENEMNWTHQDNTWTYTEDENFPANSSKLDSSLNLLTNAEINRTLSDAEDLSEYGLSQPQNKITLQTSNDEKTVIYVGNKNSQTGDTYVYLNDHTDTIYTVNLDFAGNFTSNLYDYAVGEDYPSITTSNIEQVAVKKSTDSYTLTSSQDSSSGWYVKDEKGKQKVADSTNVQTALNTVSGFTFAGYYDYNCKDWSAYGLDDPKMQITVDYYELVTSDKSIDKTSESTGESGKSENETQTEDKTLTIRIGTLSNDGNYYVRINDSSEVHGISQSALESILSAKAFDYRNTSVACLGRNHLDHLDVTYNGKTYTLTCKEEEIENTDKDSESSTSTVTAYYVDGKEVDEDLFVNFYTIIALMTYQSPLEKNDTTGEPQMTLAFYSKDKEYGDVKVTYTQRDSSFYTAADQDNNYGLVNKQNVKKMIDAFAELINSID